MLEAYDDDGELIAEVPMPDVPAETGAATHIEWKKCFRSYLFYMRKNGGRGSIRIYDLRMEEGNPFLANAKPASKTPIKYHTDGGSLAEDAPKEYDPTVDTELPIPSKNGFAFGGWYTTPTFDEGTKTSHAPPGYRGILRNLG
jgi:hypothetical protein